MHTVTSADGTRIAYDRYGEGPAVILVNGALGYRKFKTMEHIATAVSEHCTVINYDRRGFGLQIAIAGALLVVSRFAGRAANLNFAFRDPIWGLSLDPAPLHLAATLAFIVAVFYVPAHVALSLAFRRRRGAEEPIGAHP